MKLLTSFLIATLVVSACAPKSRLKLGATAQGEVVEAEGIVPIQKDDLPATEAAALAAAQRSAVEKVVGVYVSGKTLVEKATLIQSRILARTEGYISKYDILSKGPEGGFYKTRIRAMVLFSKLSEDLKAAGLLDLAEVGNPRVSVKVEETVDGMTNMNQEGSKALAQALLSRGYTVVDRSDATSAEILITGTDAASEIKDTDGRLGGLVSYRARAALQAARAGTGQLLASSSRDASGLDATKGLASAKALGSAAGLAGEELAGTMFSALQSGSETVVLLRGVDAMEKLQKFQEELRGLSGAGKVLLRRYSDRTAEISIVGSNKSAGEIAAVIARMKTVAAEVDTYSQFRVEASLKD